MADELLSIIESHYGMAKVKGDYAFIKSPFNALDKNPSCVVVLHDTYKFTEGFFKDFSTGRSGNIYSLLNIAHDFGLHDRKTKMPTLISPATVKTHISTLDYTPSPYLFGRGIPYEVQQQFRVFELGGYVSMPVFDRDGYLIYSVSRSVEGKNYALSSETSSYPAFTHTLNASDTVFVCESMINAYSLFAVGLKAISLNGAGNWSGLKVILKYHFGKIVLVLDPDEVGQTNALHIKEDLSNKDVVNIVMPMDVNDTWTGILNATPNFEVAQQVFLKLLERKINNKKMPCCDCNKETANSRDYYTVRDDVWLAAVPEENHFGVHFLCRKCLSKRLGRELTKDDFIEKE